MKLEDVMAAMRLTAVPKPKPVEVNGWPKLYVRAVTTGEVDEETELEDKAEGKKVRLARGAARVICDAEGKRIFDPENKEHIALLQAQPWSMLQKVLAVVDEDDKKAASGN